VQSLQFHYSLGKRRPGSEDHADIPQRTSRSNVISGYSDEEIADSTAAFLQKPFRMQELGAKIRNILDKSRASAA
jgi:hypothetical protein